MTAIDTSCHFSRALGMMDYKPAASVPFCCAQGWDPNDPPKQACNTTVEDDVIQRCKSDLKTWLSKLSVLIIGPGLGDDWMVSHLLTGTCSGHEFAQLAQYCPL